MKRSSRTLTIDPTLFGCDKARISAILCAHGNEVRGGECLIEFECEKSAFELTMPEDGVVLDLHVNVGDVIENSSLLLTIECETIEFRDDSRMSDHGFQLEGLMSAYPEVETFSSLLEAKKYLSSSLRIRPATTNDASRMGDIWQQSLRVASPSQSMISHTESAASWYEEQIVLAPDRFWIAWTELTSEVLGFCDVSLQRRTPTTSFCLLGLYVMRPDLVWTPGEFLIEHAVRRSKVWGVQQCLAFTHPDNHQAIRLLKWFGFDHIGDASKEMEGGYHRSIFELRISDSIALPSS